MENKIRLSQQPGIQLVTGNAGSGKTKFLLDSISESIESGTVLSDSIMFIPCKAAQLQIIKERCAVRLPASAVNQLKIWNFVDLARRIVKSNPILSGCRHDMLYADRFQKARHVIMRKVLEKCMLPSHLEPWKTPGNIVRNLVHIVKFEQTMNPLKREMLEPWIAQVLDEYEKVCRHAGIIFQEDLIHEAVRILKTHPHAVVLPQIQHIVVDDFQEINYACYELLCSVLWCLKQRSVLDSALFSANVSFAVHKYRGASTTFIQEAIKEFTISKNNIIELSNTKNTLRSVVHEQLLSEERSIQHPQQQFLFTDEKPIWCIETPQFLDQIYFCAKKIKALIGDDVVPGKIGVVVEESSSDASLCRSVFDSLAIPCEFEKGIPLCLSATFGFLKLCAQIAGGRQSDDTLLRRFLSANVFGLSGLESSRITDESRRRNIPLRWGIIRYAEFILESDKRNRLLNVLFYLMNTSSDMLSKFFIEIVNRSELTDFLLTQDLSEMDVMRKITDAAEFFDKLYARLHDGVLPLVHQFEDFEKWCLPEYIKSKRSNKEFAVQILTLFGCDSCELDYFFVLGCDEKRYPDSYRSFVPALLRNSESALLNKELFELSDRTLLINALNRTSKQAFLLFSRDNGEPSPLIDLLKQHPFVKEVTEETLFGTYTNDENILTLGDAALWLDNQLENMNSNDRVRFGKVCDSIFPDILQKIPKFDGEQERFSLSPHYTFSASGINSFLECPRRFFFSKVMKIDREEISMGAAFGQIVHRVLEIFHTLYPQWTSKDEFNKKNNESVLYRILQRELACEEELNKFNRILLGYEIFECLKRYNDFLESQIPFIIQSRERRVFFLLDAIPFSLSIDRIDSKLFNQQKVRIVDYKTEELTRLKRADTLRKEFLGLSELNFKGTKNCQLPLYYFAAQNALNLEPDALSIFYLRTHPENKPSLCHNVTLYVNGTLPQETITGEDLQAVREDIGKIVNLIRAGYFPLPHGSSCYTCFSPMLCNARETGNASE
ncbi:MAG: ATP-dependent helicase [bacterium]|nr:ATP-dependent helicase [bacterium]